jgi:hypothetical protein
MGTRIPSVVIADYGDALRIGRPHREVHAAAAIHFTRMRAEFLVSAKVRALSEEKEVVVG